MLAKNGDYTIPEYSAQLPSPVVNIQVTGIEHAWLPNSPIVVKHVFDALEIPLTNGTAQTISNRKPEDAELPLYVIVVNGQVEISASDSSGRIVNTLTSTIPGAVSMFSSDRNAALMVLPKIDGVRVQVKNHNSTDYTLRVLRNDSYISETLDSLEKNWDVSKSQLLDNSTITFVITTSAGVSTTLDFVTPIINTPVTFASTSLSGRGSSGSVVEIRDALTNGLLGQTTVAVNGHFMLNLSKPLSLGQRIYARANGISGPAIYPTSTKTMLPLIVRAS